MQIRHQIVELLLRDRFSHRRHHVSSADDRLLNKSVVRRQPAWQELLLEEVLEARPFASAGGIGIVARCAIAFEDAPPARLLRVQPQLGVRFRRRLAAAHHKQQHRAHKNCPASLQIAIIRNASRAVHFKHMLRISSTDRLFILTGAGVSAESGIPTFRGAGGLWRNYRFEEVASPHAWRRDPRLVWEFYSMRRRVASAARPNPGHLALADLERSLEDRLVLCTQNVDSLHEQAGSRRVLHMHGELFKSRCDRCDRPAFADPRTYEAPSPLPSCECGGAIRPHICWFGEVPYHLDEISRALDQCTVFIAIGTSGVVEPAASFVARVHGRAQTHYVGPEEPANSSAFTKCFLGKAGELLPTLFLCESD